jgi:hypothetical protein
MSGYSICLVFLGYLVIIPDYYRGTMWDPGANPTEVLVKFIQDNTKWETNLKVDWEKKIKPYA